MMEQEIKHARNGNIAITIKDGVVTIQPTTINTYKSLRFNEQEFETTLKMLGYIRKGDE